MSQTIDSSLVATGEVDLTPSPSGSANETPTRPIRVPPDLWAQFGEAVKQVDPKGDRSAVLRDFMRWYVHGRDKDGRVVRLPKRPAQT